MFKPLNDNEEEEEGEDTSKIGIMKEDEEEECIVDDQVEIIMKKTHLQKRKVVKICTCDRVLTTIMFTGLLFLTGTIFVQFHFVNVDPDQLAFHLNLETNGSEGNTFIISFVKYCLCMSIVLTIIFNKMLKYLPSYYKFEWRFIKIKIRTFKRFTPILVLIISFYIFCKQIDIIKAFIPEKDCNFIEENYVWPSNDILEFPKKKRNLVYIVLESMETTYSSKQYGGGFDENYIPLLTQEAIDPNNINFGNQSNIGGERHTLGAQFSIAANFALYSGLPMKWRMDLSNEKFFQGAITIPDLLLKEGYDEYVVFAHNRNSFGMGNLHTTHGKFDIYDSSRIVSMPKYAKYEGNWGIYDTGVYAVAKELIKEAANSDKPYFMALYTVDTHFPEGFPCPECRKDTNEQYFNVIRCADRLAKDFIDYVKALPRYNETTIFIVGDHISMGQYMSKRLHNYMRRVFNIIINSAVKKSYNSSKIRDYSTLDLFPTILASIGVKIKGDKLGMGTNLFSGKPTIMEEKGYNYFTTMIAKPSKFYDREFVKITNEVLVHGKAEWKT
jgi:phosphoglycerol transferase